MSIVLALLDALLGWTLAVPRLASIALLALLTSFGMTLIRRAVTRQEWLWRCRNDLNRLKQLLRAAKRAGDRDAQKRLRATAATIRLLQLRAEGRVLLFALVPLALLGAWGLERLPYRSPPTGEPLTLNVRFRPSAAGSLTHLVPVDPLEFGTPPLQRVPASAADLPHCQWTFRSERPADAELIVRCKGHAATLPVRIGRWTAFAPQRSFDSGPIELLRLEHPALSQPLTPLRLDRWLPEPEWVWWYLAATLALLPVSRRALKTA